MSKKTKPNYGVNRIGKKNQGSGNIKQNKNRSDQFVDEAEQKIKNYFNEVKNSKDLEAIKTTKLRNILSLISDIYNVEVRSTEEDLSEDSSLKLQKARIRIVYEIGRERDSNKSDKKKDNSEKTVGGIEKFVNDTKLLEKMKNIGDSRVEFINFANYMEAIVAYHRYYGGQD